MLVGKSNPHGGDVRSAPGALDFSASLNPFGTPPEVKRALRLSASLCARYPDPFCRELKTAAAALEGLPEDFLLFGNGSAELIYSYAYSLPKTCPALIAAPAFSEYAAALTAAGAPFEYYFTKEENGFQPKEDILGLDLKKYSAVFICSPANPTGVLFPPGLLSRVIETGVRVFLDLCFLDLCDEPEIYPVRDLIFKHKNVAVLRAFTKLYAIPGVRLGHLLSSDTSFLAEVSQKTQCWNVSVPAQRAGLAALSCRKDVLSKVPAITRERERVKKKLSELGLRVFGSRANYVFFYSEKELAKGLFERGIVIRDCSNFAGLKRGYYRAAVLRPRENDRLINALREVLG